MKQKNFPPNRYRRQQAALARLDETHIPRGQTTKASDITVPANIQAIRKFGGKKKRGFRS